MDTKNKIFIILA